MTRRARRAIVTLASLGAFGVAATRAYSHPLHTTLSELSLASDGGAQIILRAFVDDFSAAVAGHSGALTGPIALPPDSATARYLMGAMVLTDASGRRVTLRVVGMRRSGDLVWVTLRARMTGEAVGARLTNAVLFERYDDQVNVVQTSIGGRRRTLLFTKRDGASAKAL